MEQKPRRYSLGAEVASLDGVSLTGSWLHRNLLGGGERLLVEGEIIVELKAAKTIASEHEAQILGYLKSARKRHGLLINFGAYKFEIRKYAGKSENQE